MRVGARAHNHTAEKRKKMHKKGDSRENIRLCARTTTKTASDGKGDSTKFGTANNKDMKRTVHFKPNQPGGWKNIR